MSYVAPIVPTFNGTKNIERVVQKLQTILASELTWLSYSFGLAERFVSQGESGAYIYPATFITGQDHYDCLPNDKFKAFSFWRLNDPSELDHSDPNAYERWPYIVSDVDLVIFANISKIDNQTSQYVTRSKMRQDIINTLSNKIPGDFKLTPLRIYENDMTEIYSDYSIDQIDNLKKQLPYWAIKVNCELRYLPDCSSTSNTYVMA